MTAGHEPDARGASRQVTAATASEAADPWPHAAEKAPVFLHSSFRAGSTWLWQKLRAAPTTLAYYEIFNEFLQTLTPEKAKDINFAAWDSRHPPSTPYFLEFMPFLEATGGIAEFDRMMSFASFIPAAGPDGDLCPSEKRYVERLIAGAAAQDKIPVLACTRSIGRARALRRAVPSRTIFLHRNLFHQWASYCWQAEIGAGFFLETIRRTICGAEHDPFLRILADWFDLADPALPREELFEAFVVLHLYLYGIAFDAADLLVDVTDIATDRRARRQAEWDLSELIRHGVDLSDARETCEYTDLRVDCPDKVRDTIEQFAKLIPTTSISSDGVRFIAQAKDRTLTEWDRYTFFTRRTRSVLNEKIGMAETRLAQCVAENEELSAERDRLEFSLSQAFLTHQAKLSAQRETLRLLQASHDIALKSAAETSASCENLRHELAGSTASRSPAEAGSRGVASLFRRAWRLLSRRG